jgi:SH3-like domain-containing protein
MILRLIIIFFLFLNSAFANDILPKFMSLRVSEANVRSGPGINFPVKWVYISENLALEVIDKFDNWYKVRDHELKTGWLHKSLLSNSRNFTVIKNNASLYRNPRIGLVVFRLEKNVRGKIKSCRSIWCRIKVDKYEGWIEKRDIFGAYTYESF